MRHDAEFEGAQKAGTAAQPDRLRGLEVFVATVLPGHRARVVAIVQLPSGGRVGWVAFERMFGDTSGRVFYELLSEADLHWVGDGSGAVRVSAKSANHSRLEARDIRSQSLRQEFADDLAHGDLARVIAELVPRAQRGEWVGQLHANAFAGSALEPHELPKLLGVDPVDVELAVKDLVNSNQIAISPEGRLVTAEAVVDLRDGADNDLSSSPLSA